MREPRGDVMSTNCFVDADHADDKVTRRSQKGIILFCNNSPVIWNSKGQNGVEVSKFYYEFIYLKNAVELIKTLR